MTRSEADSNTTRRLEERIKKAAHRFDLISLVRALHQADYDLHDIVFRSVPHQGAARTLIRDITFHREPTRYVSVSLTMGLHDDRGLLPSYFMRVADQMEDPAPLMNFLAYFDSRLLHNHLNTLYVELGQNMYDSWSDLKDAYGTMTSLNSISGLHWLFNLYYPELRVSVSRTEAGTKRVNRGATTGTARLEGTAIMGKTAQGLAKGFVVRLFAPDERHMSGESWPSLSQRRLTEHVLPRLKGLSFWLKVQLTVLEHQTPTAISNQEYLGFSRLKATQSERLELSLYDQLCI